ncbi:prtrc system protein e [Chryseobacterium sp. WG23]|uniref:prtrc system protein e n=1 Tax=Chryseobacterium sp. WG23 TaxID=2926910 RepID=UPI00211E2460|nr:prtrc system protein e [Chryseobacterium sp. WG23]MCQ9634133.1 prtrc system protein e [Chryseobacterium sp. WG23]
MEPTNFFTQLAQLDINGQIVLTIAKGAENNLIVSTLIRPLSPADANKSPIIPYNLTATAEELNNCYFERVTTPLTKAGEIIDNMDEYMKSLENLTTTSHREKAKTGKPQGGTDKRVQKYEEAMKKADDLEKQGKYSDAWSALPKASEYPEHAELIKNRQSYFEQQIWPDLFGNNNTDSTSNAGNEVDNSETENV